MREERPLHRSSSCLALGLVLGLIAVAISILTPSFNTDSDIGIVAVVNGSPITRDKYLAYLQALAADKKDPVSEEDAEYVLQRLIEEELLVQRGVEVGLLQRDKGTRSALINAAVGMTTATAEAKAPTDADLADFFRTNIDYFSAAARLRVQQIVLHGTDAAGKADVAYERLLAGESFRVVSLELGSDVALQVPDRLLPATKLREYLGPTLVAMLLKQRAEYVSEPQASDSGYRIVKLVEIESGDPPRLEEIRAQVEAEYTRRAGDQALRDYLAWLKDRADISYPSELPL